MDEKIPSTPYVGDAISAVDPALPDGLYKGLLVRVFSFEDAVRRWQLEVSARVPQRH